MNIFSQGRTNRLKARTVGALAAVFAIGSVVPSTALPRAPVAAETVSKDVTNVNFEHHFWRNHPRNSQRLNDRTDRLDRTRADAGVTALAPGAVAVYPTAPRSGYFFD